jgi:hypothetical protein
MKEGFRNRRTASLRGRERNRARTTVTGRSRTHAAQQPTRHFVGAGEQRGRQLQAELPCSFLVHDHLKLGCGLNRQFGRTNTTQYSINIGCCTCPNLVDLHPIRHQGCRPHRTGVVGRSPAARTVRPAQCLNAPERNDRIRQKNESTLSLERPCARLLQFPADAGDVYRNS